MDLLEELKDLRIAYAKLQEQNEALLDAVNYYAENEREPIDYLVARDVLKKIVVLTNKC